jgi:transcriptional regulator with XRE-family HTH domain
MVVSKGMAAIDDEPPHGLMSAGGAGSGSARDEPSGDSASEAPSAARARIADRHVGSRIRERRVLLGLSQQQLAEMIDVTYQQAHKYEHGLNRISAGRLFEIAQALRVPISWFYEGLDNPSPAPEVSPRERACLELARNFVAIENEKFQEALSQMARALAARNRGQDPSSV